MFLKRVIIMPNHFFSVILILILCSTSGFSQVDTVAVNSIMKFQRELDAEYKDSKVSPLDPETIKTFQGHPYFPIDLKYKVEATLTITANESYFKMMTSNNRPRNFRQYGILVFTLDGKEFILPVYQSEQLLGTAEYADYLFLPFTDLTNGTLSYSAGRYIDLRIPEKGNSIIVDFNKAYNPLCAYSNRYSCPIVPEKNHLNIAINAGVQYRGKH
jgi:uncharacterized protein (DUF1684 family)